jgi:hypothetical protein
MINKTKGTHGGRRPGAGAPRGNLNAFKHGFCSEQYTRKLDELSHRNRQRVPAHLRGLARLYNANGVSDARRRDLAL